jgi:hypothetical protein
MSLSENYVNNKRHRPLLYRLVFCSNIALLTAIILVVTILLQPLHRAYANTEPESIVPEEVILAGGISDSDPVVISGEIMAPSEALPSVDQSSPLTPAAEDVPPPTTDNDSATTTANDGVSSDSTSTSTDVAVENSSDAELFTNATTTIELLSVSTTTEALPTDPPTPHSFTIESDTHVSFDRSDCTVVADGSYYCQASSGGESPDRPDGLYALSDSDGDLEIFLQRDGELQQLTYNTVDDASPYFDEKSNTIVWHRVVDDRFQIFSLSLDTGVESQITAGDVNNMEPHRNGEYTTWQHWNGNWDIAFFDGNETVNVSNSPAQDISPNIRNGLVIWQRISNDGIRTLELYAIDTGERTTIKDTDSGSITNPRMVVVYESTQSNGDTVTKGYDLITGEIITLNAALPVLPESIPNPDDTGETRALLQPKPGAREDSGEVLDDLPISTGGTTPLLEGDLVIGEATSTVGALIATSTQSFLDQAQLTLDLRATSSADVTSEHTLVVSPYLDEPATTTATVE